MKETLFTPPPRQRPKLDPRLATLVGLGAGAFAPGGLDTLESATRRDERGLRRAGPLAFLRGGRLAGAGEVAPVPLGGSSGGLAEVPPSVPVFVRVASPAALDRLAAAGIRLISRAKTIATADLPLARIAELEDDEDVVAVEWTGAFRPVSEAAGPAETRGACSSIGLDPARFGDLDGRGSIVGVVDVEGIDFYHPAFVSKSGRTRLLSIWDQRAVRGQGPFESELEQGPGGLGVVYRRQAIGLEIAPHQLIPYAVVDHHPIKGSHGTLTSALAVGNGDERADARGIAPGADLVFVNGFGSGAGSLGAMTELADAIAFIMGEAAALQRPCVVNLSLGDDLGPRDGTSPVERFIDELLETEGRAVVIAAGNSQGKRRHASATLGDGGDATFALEVAAGNVDHPVVEIWYERGDEGATSLSMEIEAPGDGGRSASIGADGIPRAFDAGGTRALVLSAAQYPGSSNGVIRVELLAYEPGAELLAGTWQFHVRCHGRGGAVHAWVDHRYAHWQGESETLTLTTPATARKAIVVGAQDKAGHEAACFSGRGEDRGGARRPDVLAPGTSLVGAWAASPVRYIETANGTSVAAPIVSGVAALLFQRLGRAASADRIREEIAALAQAAPSGEPGGLWIASLVAPPDPQCDHLETSAAQPGRERPSRETLPRLRPRDAAQIVQGHYEIDFEGQPAGEVLVLPGERAGVSVEHWTFGPRYSPPSPERPSTALHFRYTGETIDLTRFLSRAAPEARYVRAVCEVVPSARHRGVGPQRDDSIERQPTNIISGSNAMTTKNYMRPLDRTQIIQGKYDLLQEGIHVGLLLVTDDAPGRSTEHWVLFREYMWPSETNPRQTMEFQYRGAPSDLREFLRGAPAGSTYVIANCQQQTLA